MFKVDDKLVIFVTGTSYSGSTLLGMLLGSSDKSDCVGEISAMFRPYRKHHINEIKSLKFEKPVWRDILKSEESLYVKYFEYFSAKDIVIDTSKDLHWIQRQVRICKKFGIQTKVILSYKDIHDLVLSFEKRNLSKWRAEYHFNTFYNQLAYCKPKFYTLEVDLFFTDRAYRDERIATIGLRDEDYIGNLGNYEMTLFFGNNRARSIIGKRFTGRERIKQSADFGQLRIERRGNDVSRNRLELGRMEHNNLISMFQFYTRFIKYKMTRTIWYLFYKLC